MRCAGCPVISWPSKKTRPLVVGTNPRHGTRQRALARTVGTQDGENGARIHREGDAEEGARRPVANIEVLDGEERFGHAESPPAGAGSAGGPGSGSVSPR